MRNVFKKLIVWGHKLGTHTHSYVHNGYYRAANAIGYDTYWFDDNDDVSNFDFSNSIFITEHLVSKNMPIRNDCVYFNHNVDYPFAQSNRDTEHRLTHPNYYNFVYFSDRYFASENTIINWPTVEELVKINDYHFYHPKSKTITTTWATDLLPNEIKRIEPSLFNESSNHVFFVGSRQGPNMNKFEQICNRNNKPFTNVGGYSGLNNIQSGLPPTIEQNITLIRNSYISVDIREWNSHMKAGRYFPCRVFKNISYGKWTGSNHKEIESAFDGHITCESNLELLYEKLVKDSRDCDYLKMRKAMDFIADKHTYLNRLSDMLVVLT